MHVVLSIDQEKLEWPNMGEQTNVLALQLSKAGGLFAWSSGTAGALVCTDVATAQTCYSTSPSTPELESSFLLIVLVRHLCLSATAHVSPGISPSNVRPIFLCSAYAAY